MHNKNHTISDESGFMLIGTLLVMIAITAIGVTLINVSTFEIDMSTSEKCKEVARYNSESCTLSGAKLIKHVAVEAAEYGLLGIPEGDGRVPGVTYADNDEQALARKILLPGVEDTECKDFSLALPAAADLNADSNILPQGPEGNIATAANRQISGYSYGVGLGGAGGGGFSNWFLVACRGGSCSGTGGHSSYSRYKRVPGIVGGF